MINLSWSYKLTPSLLITSVASVGYTKKFPLWSQLTVLSPRLLHEILNCKMSVQTAVSYFTSFTSGEVFQIIRMFFWYDGPSYWLHVDMMRGALFCCSTLSGKARRVVLTRAINVIFMHTWYRSSSPAHFT